MVERSDLYDIPAPLATKLEPLLGSINEVLKYEPDFPHQRWHTDGVVRDSVYAAEVLGCGKEDIELTRLVADSHDEGYRLVTSGVLAPEEHHFGSFLIAKAKYADLTVARGALLHNQDVIPDGFPYPYTIVRDVDRLHAMGWGGVIRASYYLGFRPPDPTKAEALFERRTPDKERVKAETHTRFCFPAHTEELIFETDWERRAKIYSWLRIFPLLHQNGNLDRLAELCKYWMMAWGEGEVPKGEEFNYEAAYLTEPINDILQSRFGAKFFNTWDAQEAIEAWKERHPDGKRKSDTLEQKWARETYHPHYRFSSPESRRKRFMIRQ